MNRRGIVVGALVVAVLVAVLALAGPSEDRYDRPPLDPRGTGPSGTAALVEVLRRQGAEVRIGLPGERDDVVLLLADTLSGRPSDDLDDWIRDGGTLVVADPGSRFSADPTTYRGEATSRGSCPIAALEGIDRIDPGLPLVFDATPGGPSGAASGAASGRSACFSEPGGSAGLVVDGRGAGIVVSLAAPDNLTNRDLAEADNAGLAARLLVPWTGARVRVVDPTHLYGTSDDVGDGTVLGALPRRARDAFGQLIVAFLAWGLVRGRRLGRPVEEELPVPLPASDLVLASGRLLDRNGDASDAAERLRRRCRRDLGVAMGLGSDPDSAELVDALHARAGLDPDLLQQALLTPVVDEDGLVATSSHLDRLRRELRP